MKFSISYNVVKQIFLPRIPISKILAPPLAMGSQSTPTPSSLEESFADIDRSVAKITSDDARATKQFCVQEGKGECLDKVGAWAAACSGLDKIESLACTTAQAALLNCLTDDPSATLRSRLASLFT